MESLPRRQSGAVQQVHTGVMVRCIHTFGNIVSASRPREQDWWDSLVMLLGLVSVLEQKNDQMLLDRSLHGSHLGAIYAFISMVLAWVRSLLYSPLSWFSLVQEFIQYSFLSKRPQPDPKP